MFFVAKDKIGTTLGQQKEFAACSRRGIGFTREVLEGGHHVWHYFWPADMIEPSIRAQFVHGEVAQGEPDPLNEEPGYFIWSQEVAPGEVIGEPVIAPFSGNGDWQVEAKSNFAASRSAPRALPAPQGS